MRVKITREDAARLMEKNTNNRPITKATLKRYTKEMAEGKWRYNGETIKISKSGYIFDGQHRLQSVIDSGVTIEAELINDIDDDVFDTIDVGKQRTNGDMFAIAGVKNSTSVSSVINPFYCLMVKTPKSAAGSVLSKHDALCVYKAYSSDIDSLHITRRFMSVPPKFVHACHVYLLQFNDKDLVDSFFDQLYTGKIRDGFEQVVVLRDWFIKVLSNKDSKPVPVEYLAKVLKAFKNMKEGKNPKFLRWHESVGEVFPYDDRHISTKVLGIKNTTK